MQSCRHDNHEQETEGGVSCVTVIHWSGRTMRWIEWMWAMAELKVMIVIGLKQHIDKFHLLCYANALNIGHGLI